VWAGGAPSGKKAGKFSLEEKKGVRREAFVGNIKTAVGTSWGKRQPAGEGDDRRHGQKDREKGRRATRRGKGGGKGVCDGQVRLLRKAWRRKGVFKLQKTNGRDREHSTGRGDTIIRVLLEGKNKVRNHERRLTGGRSLRRAVGREGKTGMTR